jgi:hypothetical protein
MKRKAILIGCPGVGGFLEGVANDLQLYASFLKSDKGGGWFNTEIVTIYNKSKKIIVDSIETIKMECNDVVFSVFSGHGEYDDIDKSERQLYISNDDYIYESEIFNLSTKQIAIFDTCAELKSTRILNKKMEHFSARAYYNREKYEQICLKCPDQLLRLYSSQKGDYSNDTPRGGLYSVNLVNILKSNTDKILNIVSAHTAVSPTVIKASNDKQHPDYMIPRLLPNQILPGSINV